MVAMALQTYELFVFIKPTTFQNKNKKKGYFGALLMGILGGFFASPCATPVLIVLLALVANKASVLWGIFLLLIYAIGNSFLVITIGTSTGLVRKIKSSDKYNKFYNIAKNILGTIILLIGFYMFYLGF